MACTASVSRWHCHLPAFKSERWRRNAKNQRTHTATVNPVSSDESVQNRSFVIKLAFITHVIVVHAWTAQFILIKPCSFVVVFLCSLISSLRLIKYLSERDHTYAAYADNCPQIHKHTHNPRPMWLWSRESRKRKSSSDHKIRTLFPLSFLRTRICLVFDHQCRAHAHRQPCLTANGAFQITQ